MSIDMMDRDAMTSADAIFRTLHGRIRDADSHEMYPASAWVKEYGEIVAPLARIFIESQSKKVPNSFSVDIDSDDLPVTEESVRQSWGAGCLSVGAFDMRRRLDVMDVMGVKDCLLFGSVMAIYGHQMATAGGDLIAQQYEGDGKGEADAAFALGRAALRAHNDWCIRTAQISPRLRPVATILTHDLDEAVAECRRLIDGGVRAIALPSGATIGGKAPANPENEPSDYIRRNIRVAPFDFEPVDRFIDRYPYLEDVYCFATDYPHYEGGKDPTTTMIDRIKRFGPEVVEKIFVTNAAWVMPE